MKNLNLSEAINELSIISKLPKGGSEKAIAPSGKVYSGTSREVRASFTDPKDVPIAHSHPGHPFPSPDDIEGIHETWKTDRTPHEIAGGDEYENYYVVLTPNENYNPKKNVSSIAKSYGRSMEKMDINSAMRDLINAGFNLEIKLRSTGKSVDLNQSI